MPAKTKLDYAETTVQKDNRYQTILDELQVGQYVPRSVLINAGLYTNNIVQGEYQHVNSVLQPYLDNGQIFDDTGRNGRSQAVGGDFSVNDNIDFGYAMPTPIENNVAVIDNNPNAIVNPTEIAPAWLMVDRSDTIVPLLAINDLADTLIADAKPGIAIAVPASVLATASDIYNKSLPPVVNDIVVMTTTSYTGLYVLLGFIVGAIAYKKINFKKHHK